MDGWKLTVVLPAVALALALAGCGDSADNAGINATDNADEQTDSSVVASQVSISPDNEMRAWLDSLDEGASLLTISGTVTSTGEYTTADDPRYGGVSVDVFRPGRGGGSARAGSNADGPYSLTIYTDATHQDEPDNVVRAWVTLTLPGDARAGERYEMSSFSSANDDQVQAHLRGDGHAWTFAHQIEGELHLVELGESVTAAWRFDAADGNRDDAARVAVEGAVSGLAFTPQPQAQYELTVNGDSETHLGRIAINTTNTGAILSIGNRISLMLPSGITTGEYTLSDRASDDALRVILSQHTIEQLDGTLTLTEREGAFDADIRFDTSGEDSVSLNGRLEALALNE